MEEFLDYVIRSLVEHPDEVIITRRDEGRNVVFLLKLRQSDVGAVIGRNGQTIAAIRALVAAAAARNDLRSSVEIIED